MSFAFSYFICRFPPFFVCVFRIPFRKRRYNHCFGYNCYCDFAPSKRTPMVVECRLYVGFEFSRHYAARSGSALTRRRRLIHYRARSNPCLPKGKGHRWCPFPFGLPWGIRTPNRQNRNLILYPIALRADMKSLAGFICFRKALSDFRRFYKTAFLSVPMKVQAGL